MLRSGRLHPHAGYNRHGCQSQCEETLGAGSSVLINDLVVNGVRHSAVEMTAVENHHIVKFSPSLRRDFSKVKVEEGPRLM